MIGMLNGCKQRKKKQSAANGACKTSNSAECVFPLESPSDCVSQSELFFSVCVFLYMLLREGHNKYVTYKVRTFVAGTHNFKRLFEDEDLVIGDRLQLSFGSGSNKVWR